MAAAGWQRFPIRLEPGEAVSVALTGTVVHVHNVRRTAGACGSTDEEIDHKTGGPAELPTRFALQAADTGEILDVGWGPVLAATTTLAVPAAPGIAGDLRLAGVLEEALTGAGDNSGAFNLVASVDPSVRVRNFIAEAEDIARTVETAATASLPSPDDLALRLLRGFPLRLPSQERNQNTALTRIADIGRKIIDRLGGGGDLVPMGAVAWRSFAAWLGEWTVTPAAGGRAGFGEGWTLRAKVAILEGNAAQAEEFFTTAIENTSGRARVSLFYELGKLRELGGILFSPEGAEVATVDEMVNLLNSAGEEDRAAAVGAYDLYRLALSGVVTNGAGAAPESSGPLDRIAQYDIHYALGRLEFLRHTTESLERAATHFRSCRRLSRFRYFTQPSLYQSYSLAMLMADVVRVQSNPFHTGARVPVRGLENGSGADTVVALLDVDLRAVSTLVDAPRAAGPPDQIVLTPDRPAAGVRWLPIAQHAAAIRPLSERELWSSGRTEKARGKITDADKVLAADPAAAPLGDSILTTMGRSVVNSFTALRPGAGAPRAAFPPLTDWFQNPLLTLSLPLLELFTAVGDAALPRTLGAHPEAYLLSDAPKPGADETATLTLTFRGPDGAEIVAECTVKEDRLRLDRLTQRLSDNTPAAPPTFVVDLIYDPDPSTGSADSAFAASPRVTQLRLYLPRMSGDGVPSMTLPDANDRFALQPSVAPDVWIQFSYFESDGAAPRLLRRMEIDDFRLTPVLGETAPRWRHEIDIVPADGDSDEMSTVQWAAHIIKGPASLARAYLPFHLNLRSQTLRDVRATDLRWALQSRALPAPLAAAITEELGRRIAEPAAQSPDEDPLVSLGVVFDVAIGHFDAALSAPLQVAMPTFDTEVAHGFAASALLAATGAQTSPGGANPLRPRAREVAMRILAGLAPTVDEDTAVGRAGALARFPFLLVPVGLEAPVRSAGTDSIPASADDQEGELEAETALTRAWLDALTRCRATPRLALALAHPLVASGLAGLAYEWLGAVANVSPSTDFPDVARWLATGVLPDLRLDAPRTASELGVLAVEAAAALFHQSDPEAALSLRREAPDLRELERTLARLRPGRTARAAATELDRAIGIASDTLDVLQEQIRGARAELSQAYEPALLVIAGAGMALGANGSTPGSDLARQAIGVFRAIHPDPKGSPPPSADSWRSAVGRVPLPDPVRASLRNLSEVPPLGVDLAPWLRAESAGIPVIHPPLTVTVRSDLADRLRLRPSPPQHGDSETAAKPISQGRILPVDLSEDSLGAWETILHDEPFADSCVALVALANRYAARQDKRSASERLHEALCALIKLEADNERTTSPADRAQAGALLRRVQLRLAWLDQGRDPYGRFMTQAPPRRLRVLIEQFNTTLTRYQVSLGDAGRLEERVEARLREDAAADRQRRDVVHRVRQVRLQQERYVRSLADVDVTLSAISARQREVARLRADGLKQFDEGKAMQDKAASDIGRLVVDGTLKALPPGAVATAARNAAAATKQIAEGENPVRAFLGVYGEEVVGLAFASFDQNDLFEGALTDTVQSAFDTYVHDGKVGLGDLADRSIRRAADALLGNAIERLGRDLDELVRTRLPLNEFASTWTELKSRAEAAGAEVFKDADALLEVVGRYRLTAESQLALLERVVKHAPADVFEVIRRLVPADEVLRILAATPLPSDSGMKRAVEEILEELREKLLRLEFSAVPSTGSVVEPARRLLVVCARTLRLAAAGADTIPSEAGRALVVQATEQLRAILPKIPFSVDRILDIEFAAGSELERRMAARARAARSPGGRLTALLDAVAAEADPAGSGQDVLLTAARLLETAATELPESLAPELRERLGALHRDLVSFLEDGLGTVQGITGGRRFRRAIGDALAADERVRALFLQASGGFMEQLAPNPALVRFLAREMDSRTAGLGGLLREILSRGRVAIPQNLRLPQGVQSLVPADGERFVRNSAARYLLAALRSGDADAGTAAQDEEEARKRLAENRPAADETVSDEESAGSRLPPDQVNALMGNPTAQAILMAVGTAYPVAGLIINGAMLINNWLVGGKNRELGAEKVKTTELEARSLDRGAQEARHQRGLLELELAVARDEQARLEDEGRAASTLAGLASSAADRAMYARRALYRRMWAETELLTYQLYLLQRGFEYEFDVPLEEIFERWPQLDTFRNLLEISPGVLAGEFGRTNVHRDLLRTTVSLEEVSKALELVRDLVATARYRDTLALTLREDYPEAWGTFKDQEIPTPIRFRTTLAQVAGVRIQGRGIRHSFKIEQVTIHPELFAEGAPGPVDAAPGTLLAPGRLGALRVERRRAESNRVALLALRSPERLKLALFHSGIGDQVDERGTLRRIEWGPQVIDSNLGVAEADAFFNAAEGLTPATEWALIIDPESAILTSNIQDVQVRITFSYGRDEESVRVLHRTLAQGPALRVATRAVPAIVASPVLPTTRSREVSRALTAAKVEVARGTAQR